MKKYNCNNTLEYVHEAARMCRAFDKCEGCEGCPLAKKSCEIFDVTPEHIKRVQAWSDTHPEIMLTDKQVEIFKALNLLGFRYIAKDADGMVYIYTNFPKKDNGVWIYMQGGCVKTEHLSTQAAAAISQLVDWSDREPLCIAEALEQAEETKQ